MVTAEAGKNDCSKMLNAVAKPLVKLLDRYLPAPYMFVLLLSLLVFVAAIVFEQPSSLALVLQWGDGFWGNLLNFVAMQLSFGKLMHSK